MRLFAVLSLLLSASAFACPNLAGKYKTCRSSTGATTSPTDMVVTQTLQNKVSTYTLTFTDSETHERLTEVYKADGKTQVQEQKDPETGVTLKILTTNSCTKDALKIDMKLLMMEQIAGHAVISVTKKGKQLITEIRNSDGEQEQVETEICE